MFLRPLTCSRRGSYLSFSTFVNPVSTPPARYLQGEKIEKIDCDDGLEYGFDDNVTLENTKFPCFSTHGKNCIIDHAMTDYSLYVIRYVDFA